ncbi:transmembrane protein, putative (macronuclear) [Tetrahymena thermophila SB210]|uniref:Transmembrane protein, putative n=1 Tax=Tetrahymena thermophila (strain SB210) TaxID=312017 RepID=Q23U00_TETTS|nr:transmembrane protein, putative [Tetrahymena thermophila SB210]EAR99981.2 transmembrane protein, putative [Tetrahymena thermophila SB210]|eukprot:XP_001020226.2 transmembrane protein, putative [Tetrahymena thermophila SB210]
MSVLSQTYDEAIDTYNSVFNKSTQTGESQTNLEGEQTTGKRLLAQKSSNLSQHIQKPIFRKNVASFEFDADLRSEFNDSGLVSKEDICSVGIYSFFNGASSKIVERQTRANISKILKFYQYVQESKIVSINQQMISKLLLLQKKILS